MSRHLTPRKLQAGCLALLAVLLLGGAPQALAAHSQQESYQALLGQVNRGEVKTATISRKKSTVKIKLANRQHFVATFPASAEAQLVSSLRAHGARVKVGRRHAAKSSSHIRYRFIALAILALGALAALGYYLLRGRPAAGAEAADAGTGQAPGPPGAEPAAGEPSGEGRGPPGSPPGPGGAERA